MKPPYPYSSLTVVDETDRHWRFRCCFHEETNASFTVNKTDPFKLWFRCWACGLQGSPRNFAKIYLKDNNPDIEETIVREVEKPKIDWLARLQVKFRLSTLARKVGVSVQTIDRFNIGYDFSTDRYLIPMYDTTGICGIQETWFDGKERKKKCQRYSKHGWFLPEIYFLKKPLFYKPTLGEENLFICEGWSDAAVVTELGLWAFGKFNALAAELPPFVSFVNDIKNIYIISDTDPVGIKGSRKLQKLIPNSEVLIPYGFKDIRCMYLAEGAEKTKEWVKEQTETKMIP